MMPQGNQVSFRVAMGIAGLHLSHCRDIGPHLEFSHETQGYSPVATRYSGFLSRFNSGVLPHLLLMHVNSSYLSSYKLGVRPPVELRQRTLEFSRGANMAVRHVPSCCERETRGSIGVVAGESGLISS